MRRRKKGIEIELKFPRTVLGKSIYMVAGVLLFFVLYVWQQIEVVQVGHHINDIRERIQYWHNQNQYLQVKINENSAPQIIEKKAKLVLGMIYPAPRNIKMFSLKGTVENY